MRDVAHLEQLGSWSEPGRNPQRRELATAFLGIVPAGVDPQLPEDTAWHPVDDLPPLAFDHDEIVLAGRDRLRGKLSYTNVGFALAPAAFTLSELRDLYAAALGHDVSATNLKRVLLRRNVLAATGARREPGRSGRPPRRGLPLSQAHARDHRSLRHASPSQVAESPISGDGGPADTLRRCAGSSASAAPERVCMRSDVRTTNRSRCSASLQPFSQQPSSSPPQRRQPAATTPSRAHQPSERSTVRAALDASSFDWGVVPKQVTIHVGRYGVSRATPGTSGSTAGCSPPAASPGRLSWTSMRTRSTSSCSIRRAARCCSSGSAPAPGATRSPASRTAPTAASGSPRWSPGRTGPRRTTPTAPPRPRTSRPRCPPPSSGSLLSIVVGMPTPVSALIQR